MRPQRLKHRASKIPRQRRTERRNTRRHPRVVARQLGELIGRGLVLGIVELGPGLLAVATAVERPDDCREYGSNGEAGEADEDLAGEPRDRRPFWTQAQVGCDLMLGFRAFVVHHRGLPSVRTMRTFC